MTKSHSEIVNDSYTFNLEQVIYGNYVKLDHLNQLVYETYGNSSIQDATELEVFIDVTSVIHGLYSEQNRIRYTNITDISAGIINMCAHYRSFFRYNLGVNTRFYIINSTNTWEMNRKLVPNYNEQFAGKVNVTKVKSMIDNNMALLKILCPYLPGIYFIDSPEHFESAVIMAYIIEQLNPNIPKLIISHDMYPIQLTALYPNVSYLYTKKNAHTREDESWMLPINEKFNFKDLFWSKYGNYRKANKTSPDPVFTVSPVNVSLVFAISGLKSRGLTGLHRLSMANKFIYTLVGDENIKVDSSMYMNNTELANIYNIGMIEPRHKALDVQFGLTYYRNSLEAKQLQLVDLEDNATVNMISSKYYANNPLALNKL